MFSLFFLFFFPTWKAHFTFIVQTWKDAAFTQLHGIWLLQILLQFSACMEDMYILSYNFIKSWIQCAGFCKHPLPQKLFSRHTFGLCSLDTSLSFTITHHKHPSLLPLPPFISILLSFSGTDSAGLWRGQHLCPWPQAGCLWVRGNHLSITLPDSANKT